MEKHELFEALELEFPREIKSISELDEKKFQVMIAEDLNNYDFVRLLRKTILRIQPDADPILISVKNNDFKFEFSIYGGIYEFPHNDCEYRVEYDLITYHVTINGVTKTYDRFNFEKSEHFKEIQGFLYLIKLHRETVFNFTREK